MKQKTCLPKAIVLSPAEKDRLIEYLLLLIELDQKKQFETPQKEQNNSYEA